MICSRPSWADMHCRYPTYLTGRFVCVLCMVGRARCRPALTRVYEEVHRTAFAGAAQNRKKAQQVHPPSWRPQSTCNYRRSNGVRWQTFESQFATLHGNFLLFLKHTSCSEVYASGHNSGHECA